MRAIVQTRYGSPDDLELQEVEQPRVGDDDVLVRVRAASLHPDVWHVVHGRPFVLRLMGNGLFRPKHRIPGTDVAGIVESVGKGVTRFRAGDEVFGETITAHPWTNGGAFAEYVSVPAHLLALKPDNITFEQAASVPTSGFIALQNLRGGSLIRPGQKVLINGAGGGVGALALQLAKAHGAHVTGVDCPRKLAMLRALGADEVIDFTRVDFTRCEARYDLIFDVPGNHLLSTCRGALTPDGKYVLIGHEQFDASQEPMLGLFPRFFALIFLSLFVKQLRLGQSQMPTKAEAIAVYRELLEAGKITPVIDSTYSLSEVREAFRHMGEDAITGEVIITATQAV